MSRARALRAWGSGVSLVIVLALTAPGRPSNVDGGVAFAQDTGQPGAGQMPTPTPGTSSGPTTAAGQQPGILVPVSAGFVPDMGGPEGSFGATVIDEGGDIDEGLSNQRVDPDD